MGGRGVSTVNFTIYELTGDDGETSRAVAEEYCSTIWLSANKDGVCMVYDDDACHCRKWAEERGLMLMKHVVRVDTTTKKVVEWKTVQENVP